MTEGWVLATRAEEDLAPLRAALAERGLTVVAYPVLCEEEERGRTTGLERAVGECSLVAFTSRRAPAALRRVAEDLLPALQGLPAAVVGAATAVAARREGFRVEVVGDGGGAALAALVCGAVPPGGAVLHPCGREHREEFRDALEDGGIRVVPVVVYRLAETSLSDLPQLPPEPPRAVLLTSPRAAQAYLRASRGRYARVPHFAIGPTTASAAATLGLSARPLPSPAAESFVEEMCLTSL